MPTLSLAMIVKDEAKNLPRCLRSVAPLVPAADARPIDTSTLNVEQVVAQMMAAVSAAL